MHIPDYGYSNHRGNLRLALVVRLQNISSDVVYIERQARGIHGQHSSRGTLECQDRAQPACTNIGETSRVDEWSSGQVLAVVVFLPAFIEPLYQ